MDSETRGGEVKLRKSRLEFCCLCFIINKDKKNITVFIGYKLVVNTNFKIGKAKQSSNVLW